MDAAIAEEIIRVTASILRGLPAGKRYLDAYGLHFDNMTGYPKWTQRLQIDGKRTWRVLGSYPAMSLAEARVTGAELRAAVKSRKWSPCPLCGELPSE